MSKSESRALHEELMSCKLRTAETDTTNKQLRLRVMELETSGQIAANQVIVVLSMLCRSCFFCYMVLWVQPINKVIAVGLVVGIICNLGNLDAAARSLYISGKSLLSIPPRVVDVGRVCDC